MSRLKLLSIFLLPTIIATAVAIGFYGNGQPSNPNQLAELDFVEEGREYYLFIPSLEVAALKSSGKSWDSWPESAPDPYVEVYWRNQLAYRSSVKKDSFIAKWSNTEVKLAELLLSEKTSLEDTLAAARIKIEPEGELLIKILDRDPLGSDDLIGSFAVKLEKLKIGDQTISRPTEGIGKITLRLVRLSDTPDILK